MLFVVTNPTNVYDIRLPWNYLRCLYGRFFGLNVSQIEPLLFVGGEFRATQWPVLYQLGIRAVLSLQAERDDHYLGPLPERTLRLLVRDFHAPSLAQLAEGVEFIRAAHAVHLPVLVHCHAGVGRAPVTAAAYLVAQRKMPARDALLYLRTARPIIGVNGRQLHRLLEWERHIQKQSAVIATPVPASAQGEAK